MAPASMKSGTAMSENEFKPAKNRCTIIINGMSVPRKRPITPENPMAKHIGTPKISNTISAIIVIVIILEPLLSSVIVSVALGRSMIVPLISHLPDMQYTQLQWAAMSMMLNAPPLTSE